jgi:hypothetical protein
MLLGVLELPLGVVTADPFYATPTLVVVVAVLPTYLVDAAGLTFFSSSWNFLSISSNAYFNTTISASFSFCFDCSYSIISRYGVIATWMIASI